MNMERSIGIAEEIAETQSLGELKALHCFGQAENNEYADASFVHDFKVAAKRLKGRAGEELLTAKQEVPTDVAALEAEVARLQAMLAPTPPTPPVKVVRGSKRYKLLSTDVSWSTKPQVGAIAAILAAHAKIGDVLQEEHIIQMMEANVGVLQTRQGGKRVWKYYRGNHAEGLEMHGNIVEVL